MSLQWAHHGKLKLIISNVFNRNSYRYTIIGTCLLSEFNLYVCYTLAATVCPVRSYSTLTHTKKFSRTCWGRRGEEITSNQKRWNFLISHSELVHTDTAMYGINTGLVWLKMVFQLQYLPWCWGRLLFFLIRHFRSKQPFGMSHYQEGLIALFLLNSPKNQGGRLV